MLCIIAATAAIGATAGTTPGQERDPGVVTSAPRPHQRFIENKGQLPAQVKFRAEFGTASMFAESGGITWSMLQPDAGDVVHEMLHAKAEEKAAFKLHGHAWRMRFVDANGNPAITSFDRSTTYLNYFLGNDPRKWAGNVGVFGEVLYEDVWNGIDLRLHGDKGGFKYDVLLDAGADVSMVRFNYEGLDALGLDADGRLSLRTSVSELLEMAPVAWYADGGKEAVQCNFTLKDGTVGFAFAAGTDTRRPIVIDPLLIASTLSGTGDIGTTQNYGHSATYDDQGNIYTGAICFGQGYPATPGAFDLIYGGGWTDIAVSKLNPDGSALLYATYLGGSGGDHPHSLVVTPSGELTVYGTTESVDYPVSSNAFQSSSGGGTDIVVSKLTISGAVLVGSTYVGGAGTDGQNSFTSNYGDSYRGEVISDAAGNILISSCSQSTDFPTTAGAYQPAYNGGAQDGVFFSLNNDLSAFNWSSYLGTPGDEMCFGIKLTSAEEVIVAGGTSSAAFPTTVGVYQPASTGGKDAFVAHFSNGASTLVASTYFGAATEDVAFFLQLDLDDDIYIYGQSEAGGISISPAGTYGTPNTDIFIAEFTADLTTNIFKSVVGNALGGFGNSLVPVAFLVDHCDHVYISGYGTYSGGFDTTPGALYTTGGFYLAAYDADMSGLLYGTYYEGAGHVDGGTSRFDPDGVVYQGVCTSGPFPTTPNAFSNTQPSSWDVGVFKIDFQQSGVNANISASSNTGCAPATIDFDAVGQYATIVWDFGDGSPTQTADSVSHAYPDPGTYIVTLIAYDPASCNLSDTATLTVVISNPVPVDPVFTVSQAGGCEPYTVVTVNGTTGPNNTYLWDMGDGTTYTSTNVTHTYDGPGTYTITLTVTDNTCGTTASSSQPVTVTEAVELEALFSAAQVDQCTGLNVTTTNLSTGPSGLVYTWNMGDSTVLTGSSVNYTYTTPGTYTITLIAYDPLCDEAETFQLDVNVQPSPLVDQGIIVPNIFSPNQDGLNDSFFPIPGAGGNVILKVWNRWGMKMFETTGQYRPWDGRTPGNKPVPDGVYFFILEYSIPCTGSRIEGKKEGYVHVVGSTM
ncbi:MAG: PKD domain-containing protein [Flavobacteriales bacterium]